MMVLQQPPLRFGILVPSSNTTVEPLSQAIISSLNSGLSSWKITLHFARFPVQTIFLHSSSQAQFDLAPIIAAAKLLDDIGLDGIGYAGTSAGWLGFDWDIQLCNEILKSTNVTWATTSVRALNKALEVWGVKNVGLVTPFNDDIQAAIIKSYGEIGMKIGPDAERHLGLEKNWMIGRVKEDLLDRSVEEVVASGVDAITIFCTNLVSAHRVEHWEGLHKIPVFDTVSVLLWDMLGQAGIITSEVKGWGIVFEKYPTPKEV
jgi:maleate isomerase